MNLDSFLGIFDIFLLVFARMGGMIFINPIFSRRNVPMRVRIGLVLALSLLVAPGLNGNALAALTDGAMIGAMLREVVFGLMLGFIFYLFFYMLYVAGDLLDTVFGFAMSKVFDPAMGVQTSTMSSFLQILFVLYFFATGSHYILIKLFTYTYELVPVGAFSLELAGLSQFLTGVFTSAFLLVIKLTLPFVAASMIVEIGMGILMKLVPQIHVFVINVQTKILAALVLVFVFAKPIGNFIDRYIGTMIDEMQDFIRLFV